jgi:hypothetical protein
LVTSAGVLLVLVASCVSVTSGYAIGPTDDGTTKSVTVGSELRLTLPADRDWALESTDTAALPLKSSQIGTISGQTYRIWLFDVKKSGDFTLRATGQPPCLNATPPCSDAPIRYLFKIHAV